MGRIKPLTPLTESRVLMSEEALMLAVLEQAVADLEHHCPAVRADAEAYFFNYTPDSSTFSFEAACNHFGLSTSAIRRQLRSRCGRRRMMSTLENNAA